MVHIDIAFGCSTNLEVGFITQEAGVAPHVGGGPWMIVHPNEYVEVVKHLKDEGVLFNEWMHVSYQNLKPSHLLVSGNLEDW